MNLVRARVSQKAREDGVADARLQTGFFDQDTRVDDFEFMENANVSMGAFFRSSLYIFYANLNFEMLGSALPVLTISRATQSVLPQQHKTPDIINITSIITFQQMKLSKSKGQWAFIASLVLPSPTLSLQLPPPTLSLQPPFHPDGAVLGNVDTLEGMSPRVVLKYLASCANVTGIEAPGSDCLFKNYIDEQFPGTTWGNVCSPPDINMANITANLVVAAAKCSEVIDNEFLQTAVMIMKVIATESCWNELCELDDISLRIESQYIESCSDVELPYPVESAMAMFPTDDEMIDGILTCMVDFIMHTQSTHFGLQDPPSPCYPPGYENITAVCSSVLAPRAFAGCIDAYYFEFEEDDMRMSFDYEMSIQNPGQDDDDDEDVDLFVKFCDILEGLTTGPGLECLDDICQEVTPAPSASPSSSTTSPTDSPTAAPSVSPPGSPTTSPTSPPTASPTDSPTGAPTASPHVSLTTSPTSRPTVSPTDSPTGAPTTSPPGSPTPSPTGSPTALPTGASSPIGSPTASPTDSPTGVSTVSPTPWPSRSLPDSPAPSSAPSTTPPATAPSKSPRSSPSTPPSPFPSVVPSEFPSASPTLIITNQDIAQSSAAFVPTVSILGISLLMGSLLIM